MAPFHSRQLLAWTFPTITILLSYLWYKRKRIGVRSDPGGTRADNPEETGSKKQQEQQRPEEPSLDVPKAASTPEKKFSRSLSGVETAPIDIVIPRELRSVKSNPVVISDEDLDLEIEKIKSMKSDKFNRSKTTTTTTNTSVEKSPVKEDQPKVEKKVAKQEEKKMAQQKEMACVEEKLSNLKLGSKKKGKSKGGNKGAKVASEQEELQRQSSERDSANHSPADVMLASPSLSSISDNHSEVGDSKCTWNGACVLNLLWLVI